MNEVHEIEQAYSDALLFAKNHYENFPVASFLFPKEIRKDIAIVYQFARMADDIADEGEFTAEERIIRLDEFQNNLQSITQKSFNNPFWKALKNTIIQRKLKVENLSNLLIAFKQDITKKRYKDFEELLEYCKYSANPVGRIVLELNGIRDEEANQYSDNICTALQLTNFLQDVYIDFLKDRIYIPLDELEKFNISESFIAERKNSKRFQEMMKHQVKRVHLLFNDGEKLLPFLPFRLKYQIKWTLNGGRGILNKIKDIDFDVLNQKPKFTKLELMKLIIFSR